MTVTVPTTPSFVEPPGLPQRAHPPWCGSRCEATLSGLHRTNPITIPTGRTGLRGNRPTVKVALWAANPNRRPMVETLVLLAGRTEFVRFDLDLTDVVELRAALARLLTLAGQDVTP